MILSCGWAVAATAPFMAAYVHINQTFDLKEPEADREAKIATYLDDFARSGLRIVMPYVNTGSGAVCFPSALELEQPYGAWDPVGVFVREARKRGLLVYPAVCMLASGHTKPAGILAKHPAWALRDKTGAPMGFLSPGHPEVQEHLLALLREIITRYQPEGLLLDYMRYPNQPVDLDADSSSRFLKESGRDAYDIGSLLDPAWLNFRKLALTELMGRVHALRAELNPHMPIGLYTWGAHVAGDHFVGQDWPAWVRRGYVDIVNVSGYCYPANYGEAYLTVLAKRLEEARALMPTDAPALLTMCLGVKTSHGSVESAAQIREYLVAAREQHLRGVAVFTFSYLQPFLNDVLEGGYFEEFAGNLPPVPAGNAAGSDVS